MLRPSRAELLKGLCVFTPLFLVALLACACGGGGGSNSAGTPEPPGSSTTGVPTVSSVSPSTISTADAGSIVTIAGSGFSSASVVKWNGAVHASTFVSPTEIQFAILASDLSGTGSVQITVTNPGTDGGTAAPHMIAIVNPAPAITSLSPATVAPGSGPTTLTVNGTGFVTASVVEVNGSPRTTAYVAPNELNANLTDADTGHPTTLLITVANGTTSGGSSAPAKLVVSTYARPSISSINPTYIPIGSLDTAVDIQGSGFTAQTAVQVGGTILTPLIWDSSQVLVSVPAASFIVQGTLSLTASNPGPLVSNAETITVGPNLTPSVTQIGPSSAAAGGPAFALTVNGANFVPASVVQWNGSARPTTFVTANEITAAIPASDLQSLGNSSVSVTSPAPGGGTSTELSFTTFVSLTTNDIVYSSASQLFYASIPSSAGPGLGNSIVSVDPVTGAVGTPIFVGSEPNHMAISSDGSTIWVALDGAGAVRKVDLGSRTAGVQFSLGGGEGVYNPPHLARALAVMPGQPNTVAVTGSDDEQSNIVTIYDNGVPRPNTKAAGFSCCISVYAMTFDPTGTKLYVAGQGYGVATLDNTGVTAITSLNPNAYTTDLRIDNGFAYLTSGVVLHADTGVQVGVFSTSANSNAAGPVAPDSGVGRAFILAMATDQNNGLFYQMNAYDASTFLLKGSFPVNGIYPYVQTPQSLTRWGQDGLAFSSGTQIFVFRTPLIRDLSTSLADLKVTSSLPLTATTGTTVSYTLTVKNSGPVTATGIKLVDNVPDGVVLQGVTSSQGTCTGGAIVLCDLGSLNAGSSATVHTTITPLSPGTLGDTAYASAMQGDPNPADNTLTTQISITGSAFNPTPVLTSIAPNFVKAGSTAFTLTASGSGFVPGATMQLNGAALPTAFVSASQLTATVDGSAVGTMGWSSISVVNPAPGGTSSTLPLTTYLAISLDVNRLVFDPFTRKIYATIPSSATQVAGNSLVAIDPSTGVVGSPLTLGSEPNRVAESSDGRYLYVGLDGSQSLTRVDLTTMTQGAAYPLLNPGYTPPQPFAATDLAVVPGNDNLVGVGLGGVDGLLDISGSTATLRPHMTNVYSSSNLVFADANTMYSYDGYTSGREFYRWSIDSSGFTLEGGDGFTLNGDDGFALFNGLIYGFDGGIIDPTTTPPTQLAQLRDNFQLSSSVAANIPSDRIFYLAGALGYATVPTVLSYDVSRYELLDTAQLSGTAQGLDLVRWGRDGLAWHSDVSSFFGSTTPGSGQLFLMRGPFVLPEWGSANPTPGLSSLLPSSATVGSASLTLTVTGSSFVSGAVVLWNGAERTTTFVDSSHLTVSIPASDLSHTGTSTLVVNNPGSANSGSMTFAIH